MVPEASTRIRVKNRLPKSGFRSKYSDPGPEPSPRIRVENPGKKYPGVCPESILGIDSGQIACVWAQKRVLRSGFRSEHQIRSRTDYSNPGPETSTWIWVKSRVPGAGLGIEYPRIRLQNSVFGSRSRIDTLIWDQNQITG